MSNLPAVITQPGGSQGAELSLSAGSRALYTFEQKRELAQQIAESGFIKGAKGPSDVLALMLVCEAQDRPLGEAITRFHIIEGQPSVKADVMLADFQARGGRVKWIRSSATECWADFWHDKLHPEHFEVRFTLQEFIDNGTATTWSKGDQKFYLKGVWTKNPAAMMRARAVSAGVRAVDPGAIYGFYTPEEMSDLDDRPRGNESIPVQAVVVPPPAAAPVTVATLPTSQAVPVAPSAAQAPRGASDIPLPGGPAEGFDGRPVHALVQAISDAGQLALADTYEAIYNRCVQTRLYEGDRPKGRRELCTALDRIYTAHRDWFRSELAMLAAVKDPELEAGGDGPGVAQADDAEAWPKGRE